MEFEILVSYDIENNKIRSKLFDKLKDFGLRPLQKSVFWGRIRKPEEKLLISYINQNIGKADSFFIQSCELSKNWQIKSVGFCAEQFAKFEHDII